MMVNPVDKAMLKQYASAALVIAAIMAAIALVYRLFFSRKSTKSFALSRQQLQQIPIFLHSGRAPASSAVGGGGGGGAASCAICLLEYGRGEECRRMPLCGHWFHAECVDQWLLKAGTCPACRALVAV